MNFDRYTIKSQEAIQKAADIAQGNQQQAIEPGHLLKALLVTDENVISFLVKKLNINRKVLQDRLEEAILSYPRVSGQQPYLSNDSAQALQQAEKELKEFKDEYIAVEHMLMGILAGKEKISGILKD
ncbi:MAG: type VI secretion system ATPase TssH, partial [Cyclobacteriaceae bacterium]|nr:type VI secretion system ATPase TssH [Cyclobacteriaceae bacterium]